jgi:hypothetical protein
VLKFSSDDGDRCVVRISRAQLDKLVSTHALSLELRLEGGDEPSDGYALDGQRREPIIDTSAGEIRTDSVDATLDTRDSIGGSERVGTLAESGGVEQELEELLSDPVKLRAALQKFAEVMEVHEDEP